MILIYIYMVISVARRVELKGLMLRLIMGDYKGHIAGFKI